MKSAPYQRELVTATIAVSSLFVFTVQSYHIVDEQQSVNGLLIGAFFPH